MAHAGTAEFDFGISGWSQMTATVLRVAHEHGYVEAAPFGPSFRDTHQYFVRAGAPDAALLIGLFRSTPSTWYDGSNVSNSPVGARS